MGAPALTLLALALLLGSAAAAPKQGDDPLPSWYRCRCPGRGAAPDCVCPSVEPPGGLSRAETPQFVLFTHDDAVKDETYEALTAALGGRESATGGCQASATLFTLARGTNCTILQQLYDEGHEVATHSLSHQKMNGWVREEVDDEVAGGRASLATKCGIPVSDIQGFRQPFLQASPTVREVLAANGFLYDASLIENPEGESISKGLAARLWPYSLQDGIPQNCDEWAPFQTCEQQERYHGLFEVPVWDMESEGLFSKDASARKGKSVYRVLVDIFDAAYEGNRAPVPLFVHGGWLQENVEDVARFVDYALAKPGTFFVTVRQLLAWLQNPQPAAELTAAQLGCGRPGGAPGFGPAAPEEDADGSMGSEAAPAPQAVEALQAGAAALEAAAVAAAETAVAAPGEAAGAPGAAAAAAPQAADAAVVAEEEQQQQSEQAAVEPQAQQPGSTESVQQQRETAAAARAALESPQPAAASSESSSSGSSNSSSGGSSNLPAIIAGAVGGAVAAIAAIAAAALLVQRRRRQRAAAEEAAAAMSSNGGWINRHGQGSHAAAGGEPAAGPEGAPKGLAAIAVHAWQGQMDLAEVVEQSGTPSSARRRGKTPFQP